MAVSPTPKIMEIKRLAKAGLNHAGIDSIAGNEVYCQRIRVMVEITMVKNAAVEFLFQNSPIGINTKRGATRLKAKIPVNSICGIKKAGIKAASAGMIIKTLLKTGTIFCFSASGFFEYTI